MKRLWMVLLCVSIAMPMTYSEEVVDGEAPKVKLASWKIKGSGLIQNFALKRQLNTIFDGEKEFFEAVDIEDAALILLSGLQSQGYQDAKAEAILEAGDGTVETVVWDREFSVVLPRDTKAKKVTFNLQKGDISYIETVELATDKGILEQEEVEEFFFSEGLPLQGNASRVYTPSIVNTGAANIEVYLKQQGFQESSVVTKVREHSENSSVAKVVSVQISEGPLYVIRGVDWNIAGEVFEPEVDLSGIVEQPYSRFVVQDILKSLRNQFFAKGYPEVDVSYSNTQEVVSDDQIDVWMTYEIDPGDELKVGALSITGADSTKSRFLDSRMEIKEGDPLNPILLEKSRLNLSRIGIFGRVDYSMSEAEEGTRDLSFQLDERSPWKLDVIAGWGSYEQLRTGFTAERLNVWGIGHRARFRSVVSMKSALGEWRYLYPQIFNSNASVSSKVFALERDENAYTLEQVGFDLGVSGRIEFLDADADVVYTYESVATKDSELGNPGDSEDDSLVGSLGVRVGRDRRDNPINPRSGYRATSSLEWAGELFGGEADYQQLELAYSSHGEVGKGIYWHGNLSFGMIGSLSESESQVPEGKLFYQGGENSVRGYKRGDATPVNSEGLFVGARSFALLNLEVEQLLTDSMSVVLFYDGLSQTTDFGTDPFDEYLSSIGLGLRFKTFMGPIRFEYGHNLDAREGDSSGAFHFSIGYPF